VRALLDGPAISLKARRASFVRGVYRRERTKVGFEVQAPAVRRFANRIARCDSSKRASQNTGV